MILEFAKEYVFESSRIQIFYDYSDDDNKVNNYKS